ncbi:MAG: hypothetical protein ABL921_02250 [Pirellula sp.]
MGKFIHIRSSKFPILPGEREELVNDGMFGKALAEYLRLKLCERGYDAPFVCCEDWGWWVELKTAPFVFGVCIYSGPMDDGPVEFVCTDGATGPRIWSWRQFRFIDTSPWVDKLHDDLIAVFRADQEIEVIGVTDELPDLGAEPATD